MPLTEWTGKRNSFSNAYFGFVYLYLSSSPGEDKALLNLISAAKPTFLLDCFPTASDVDSAHKANQTNQLLQNT